MIDNHKKLNDLCHQLDSNRLTAVAAVSMCPIFSPYLQISDIVAYNHYFGWYGGDTSKNGLGSTISMKYTLTFLLDEVNMAAMD